MRQRKLMFAVLALLLMFIGCKGESPTAPPPVTGTSGPPTGGTTPPTNASINLTATNTNPLVNSNSIITATVTQDGANVPNGTAVQFTTTLGTFTDTGANATLKTTTNGAAAATLTSAAVGTAVVTATVNNASKSINITFSAQPVTPPAPSTAPTITSVTPSTGLPPGGQQVTISGTNFREPVRVIFTCEGDVTNHNVSACSGQGPKDAFVVSVSATQIVAIVPSFNLANNTAVTMSVTVFTQAGSPAEQSVTKAAGFTVQTAVLTPSITVVNPATGPSTGGTRITITGSGFQAPVQVTFGTGGGGAGAPLTAQVELQVISVNFSQIIALTPEQRLIDPTLTTQSMTLRVLNINSAKDAVLQGAFRFLPKMQITTIGPTEGPFTGGTRVRIDGIGFDDPVAVVIGGIAAQVISVSGSQIVAITSPVRLATCGDVTGDVAVTNTNNGDSAKMANAFTYLVPKPAILNISNPNPLGGTATITVLNALGNPRITIGGVQASITASTVNANGTTTFTVQIPSTIQMTTITCTAGGTAPQPTAFDVVYTSLTTGCSDTAAKGMTVTPAAAPVLFLQPGAFQPFTATITKGSVGPPLVLATVTASTPQTVTIVNNGTTALQITAITTANGAASGCANFAIAAPPIPPTISLNQCESLPIIAKYNGLPQTTVAGTPETATCTLTITTNAGTKSFLLVGTTQ